MMTVAVSIAIDESIPVDVNAGTAVMVAVDVNFVIDGSVGARPKPAFVTAGRVLVMSGREYHLQPLAGIVSAVILRCLVLATYP